MGSGNGGQDLPEFDGLHIFNSAVVWSLIFQKMNYNEYNLGQLLELALRVPEVGAVNFNILYYILKTIIEKEGLEEIKPIAVLDSFITQPGPSLKRSFSDESLVSDKDKLRGRYDEYDAKSHKKKESLKWKEIQVFKRLDAVEEEIDSIHQGLSGLLSDVSNLEKVSGLQETRFLNELANFHESVESKLEINEYNVLSEKVEDVVSKVSLLMEMKEEVSELKQKYEEIAERDFSEEASEIHSEKSNENLLLETKSSEVPLFDTGLDEKRKVSEIKLIEPETKEDVKPKLPYLTTESEKPEEVVKPEVIQKEIKKPGRLKSREQEILSKIEVLNEEIVSIKEHMKSGISFRTPAGKDDHEAYEMLKEGRVIDLEDAHSKQEKMDLHLLDVSTELHKLMDKCNALDRTLSQDISQIKESTLILEYNSTKYIEEAKTLKVNMHEFAVSLEAMRKDLTHMETQVAVLTEFPGLKNRISRLEEYVYSGSDYRHVDVGGVHKTTAEEAKKVSLKVFKPTTEESKVEYMDDETEKDSEVKHLRSVAQGVLLVQDMDRKTRRKIPRFPVDLYRTSVIDDIYVYEESYKDTQEPEVPEDFQSDDSGEIKKVPSHTEVSKKVSDEIVKSTTFASQDLLEELKKKVVLYVKKRLHDFEMELQVLEGNITSVKKKTDYLEKYSKDLGEKITFMDANFSQRAGDLAALKNTAESHQASIVSIMHHLERKAEVYSVNQKVSKRELAVIEDRVLKLCKTTSSEIMKLEEKIHDSFEKFNSELDKKLFIEEFEIRLDFLKHKLKVFDIKLKDLSIEPTVVDFQGIRPPVEIKKYVMCKDGTKIKQARRTIATGKTISSPDSIIPLLCQHHADREVSPKTAAQVQKELQLASSRESKRYVEGAYTKIRVGKK